MTATRTPTQTSVRPASTRRSEDSEKAIRLPLQQTHASHYDTTQSHRPDLPAYYLTSDPHCGDEAADLAAAHGLTLQTLFPKEGLPGEASVLFVALDELLLDARARREYLGELRKLELPYPVVVIGYDFQLDPLTVERSDFLRAARLGGDVFAALGYRSLAAADHQRYGAVA